MIHACGHPHHAPVAIAKAGGFDPAARKAEAELAKAVKALLAGLPDTPWLRELVKLIAASQWAEATAQLNKAPYPPEVYSDLMQALGGAMEAGVKIETAAMPPPAAPLPQVTVLLSPSARTGAILGSPAAQQFIGSYAFDLIQQINESTREGIRATVADGIAGGNNPRATAVQVRELVGLTARQSQAVTRFRKELENWHKKGNDWASSYGLGEKITRAPGGAQVYPVDADGKLLDPIQARRLRDFRYDKQLAAALASKKPLTAKQIDTMVAAYEKKYLKYRAENIARTESIRALNAGKYLSWKARIDSGEIDGGSVYKKWVIAESERTCPMCRGIAREYNKLNKGNGIPWNQYYDLSQFSNTTLTNPRILYPGAHPSCRCTLTLRVVPAYKLAA